MKKEYKEVKCHNIDELMKLADKICLRAGKKSKLTLEYRNKILDGSDNFDDFKKNTVLLGIRTTLDNELKVSDTEALNYLMGFPLNFELKSFLKMVFDDMGMNENLTNIDKIKHLTKQKTVIGKDFFKLKLDFDKKQKLISQNFENLMYIDVQEFLAWSENNGFIKNKVKISALPPQILSI